MRILAVVGSPRKGGNTDLLMDAFIEGAREVGAEVEKVYLVDLDIAPCDACDVCRATGNCAHDDDMIELYDKLLASDVWALGTPVYWWGPSAIMKAFIDRWYFFTSDRSRFEGKVGVLISPFATDGPYAGYQATELGVSALGGWMSQLGAPRREPVRPGCGPAGISR